MMSSPDPHRVAWRRTGAHRSCSLSPGLHAHCLSTALGLGTRAWGPLRANLGLALTPFTYFCLEPVCLFSAPFPEKRPSETCLHPWGM